MRKEKKKGKGGVPESWCGGIQGTGSTKKGDGGGAKNRNLDVVEVIFG